LTPQTKAKVFDWRNISAIASIIVLLASLVYSYGTGNAENKASTQRHDMQIDKNEKRIEVLQEKKADKEDVRRLEEKLDKQDEKLDRILIEVEKRRK
jgi:hypothetical protein